VKGQNLRDDANFTTKIKNKQMVVQKKKVWILDGSNSVNVKTIDRGGLKIILKNEPGLVDKEALEYRTLRTP
jgi:hypothetical protein